MNLGSFSVSLCVKSIEASLHFYEMLGFTIIDGGHQNDSFPDTETAKWRILEGQRIKIGLFQGMFKDNILTFNPKNVIAIQNELKLNGVKFISEANTNSSHPSAMASDPDGNMILFDQM